MAARRTRITRPAKKTGSSWTRLVAPVASTIATSTKVLVATFTLVAGVPRTIRRTRGEAFVNTAAAGNVVGAMGLMVVTDLAVATGAAAIPGPVTDANDDGWFVWQTLIRGRPAATQQESDAFTFDSKAMRKLEEGQIGVLMVENASASLAFDFVFGIAILSTIT